MPALLSEAWILLGAIAIVSPLRAAHPEESETNAPFTICVYNYAGLPAQTLVKSEREVDRIFQHAGIGLGWFLYDRSSKNNGPLAVCGDAGGVQGLVLKLISEQMAERLHPVSNELGFAAGTQAWVFVDRVRTVSEFHDFFIILGDVMAHELGHLLLGPEHARIGIMRASYGSNALLDAEFGSLLFTPEQGRCLRNLTYRIRPKPFDNRTLRSSLPQTSRGRQYALALPESSQPPAPSDGRPRAGQ